jgi:hypothetical protein
MRVDNNNVNNKRKIPNSAEIVDVPPSTTYREISLRPENDDTVSPGTTKLSKEEMQLLFQGRNLLF